MLANGINPVVVRDLGGWADLKIVSRYAHSDREAQRQAVATLVPIEKTPDIWQEFGQDSNMAKDGR